ncbi:hypothetical protein NDU88_003670 [Pleurodeles waltl]|uniref:Uncharacterized protein n=1 Tax=Pleurodeles waltl TaxID=8319 RepID=A0AAV7TQD2_PLEWA|nr:hypothetical protein NDU88_003670 [Pleurodeles waltl]
MAPPAGRGHTEPGPLPRPLRHSSLCSPPGMDDSPTAAPHCSTRPIREGQHRITQQGRGATEAAPDFKSHNRAADCLLQHSPGDGARTLEVVLQAPDPPEASRSRTATWSGPHLRPAGPQFDSASWPHTPGKPTHRAGAHTPRIRANQACSPPVLLELAHFSKPVHRRSESPPPLEPGEDNPLSGRIVCS